MTVLNIARFDSVLPATLTPNTLCLVKTEAGVVAYATTPDQNPQAIPLIVEGAQPAAGESIHPFALLGVR